MSSQSRRYRLARAEAADFMPPNLQTLESTPFGDAQRTRLSSWLREAAWPRAHMEMAELEGYLVALIAWPVGIAPGAWLPPIWGERGWKVPNNISSHRQYDEFVALIVGFMRTLDHELSHESPRFESSVLRLARGNAQVQASHCWGRGFMTALTLGAQGLKGRSAAAIAAVHAIANITAASAQSDSLAVERVAAAVAALMEQRASRGPLGPLTSVLPLEPPASAADVALVNSARSRARVS